MISYRLKIVLIGPAAVGKTALVKRFVENTFSTKYTLTIGVDFLTKAVNIDDENIAALTIWDIGGQERFEFMRRRFYDGAHGALLVFDLSRAETFTQVQKWLKEMRQMRGEDVPFLLIGNKADLLEDTGEVVKRKDANEFAESEGSLYIETSAKTGENVEEAFNKLTKIIVEIAKTKRE